MIVQCPACSSRYRIRDDNIPPTGGKIRCPSCGHSFIVYPENPASADASTTVTGQGVVNEYMQGRKQPGTAGDHETTEIVSNKDLDALKNLPSMQGHDIPEDGTVEIKNPMSYWEDLKNVEVEEKIDAPSSAYAGTDEPSDSDYDAAPTEIVSPDNLNLPFPGNGAKKSPPSIPAPTSGPAGRESNLPNLPPPRPNRASTPPIPSPNTPAPGRQIPESPQNQQDPFGRRDQVRENAAQAQHRPGSSPGYPPSQPFDPPTEDDFQPAGSSSQDILAAIEEASQAHDDGQPAPGSPPSGGQIVRPDPDHAGPWKLKTNFGLTYEFPDTRSLKNWLNSRDELTGYSLSADGSNFFALSEFPQVGNRAVSGPSQSIASSGLIPQPDQLPPMPSDPQQPQSEPQNESRNDSAQQSPQTPGFGSPNRGFGSGRFQPLPENPDTPGLGAPVSNEFQPPSREARYNGLLWIIFFALLAVCIVVALQTFEIYDFKALLGSSDDTTEWVDPDPVIPAVAPDEQPDFEETDSSEIDRLLDEASREIRENRLQSALDRIKTVRMLEPDHLQAIDLAIEAHEKLGQSERADELRQRAETLRSEVDGSPDEDSIDAPQNAEDDDVPGTAPPARDK